MPFEAVQQQGVRLDVLERLLNPIKTRDFFQTAWDREPLYVGRNDPSWFNEFFRISDLDALTALAGHPGTVVRFLTLKQNRNNLPGATPSEIRQAYLNGMTLVINNAGNIWPPLGRLCRGLEEAFAATVKANFYLTPPNSAAFPAHWDAYTVFAIQLYGAKTWKLGGPRHEMPLETQKFTPPVVIPEEAPCHTLRAGDTLYVPRGYTHEVWTGREPSVHVTIGIHPPLWVDVAHEMINQAALRLPALRRAVLADALAAEAVPDDAALAKLISEIAGLDLAAPALRAVIERRRKERREPVDHLLADLVRERSLGPDTPLRRREGMEAALDAADEKIVFRFLLGEIKFPARARAALTFVDEGEVFTPADLPELDEASALRLAEILLKAGYLGFVGDI